MKKYKEPQGLNHVAKFHHAFDLPVIDKPEIPSVDRCKLRVNLLQEELDELKEAIAEKDLVEIADALCDLQYVLSGAILEFGLGDKFAELFDEVQRSNMSKICESETEAHETQKHYLNKSETTSHILERDGQYYVYRDSDKKVLKSVNYSPADLKSML